MDKKVEVLAPAGNYEGFIGAINGGADAIYLGGEKFSARAYADNFSDEKIVEAINYAHLFGVKVYLTLNTLIKEREFDQIKDYVLPFYNAGLDGIIIQDIGVFHYIKSIFPGLELHVSTQMTITGKYGAALLKEMGASRIVPARELSLQELAIIKENVDIEIEVFVHGAMCYCYSGQCLFSSIVGGRSGNRGRCAQPCRLPYDLRRNNSSLLKNPETYLMSLKDMYTMDILDELINIGIDSFKIEGRMKKPEYAAGVSALYKKYSQGIDGNDDKNSNSHGSNEIEENDIARIKSLYIRSDLQSGYFFNQNGKEMVTLNKPSYSGSDEEVLNSIKTEYLDHKKMLSVDGIVRISLTGPMEITISGSNLQGETITIHYQGEQAEKAKNRPISSEDVRKQLIKTGSTHFIFKNLEIYLEEDIFVPNSTINQLRRDGLNKFEQVLLKEYQRQWVSTKYNNEAINNNDAINNDEAINYNDAKNINEKSYYHQDEKLENKTMLSLLISTKEQLQAVKQLNDDVWNHIQYIAIESDFIIKNNHFDFRPDITKYLAMPYIIREKDEALLDELKILLNTALFSGVLVRNFEAIEWLNSIHYKGIIISDAGLYVWNMEAKKVMLEYCTRVTAPFELNIHELKEISSDAMEIIVYGYIPFMITANCMKKTSTLCDKTNEVLTLRDRYQNDLPVRTNCQYCYNIIYNSLPLSFHGNMTDINKTGIKIQRLAFTVENQSETKEIIEYFHDLLFNEKRSSSISPPYKDYTKGHFKRGVE